MHRPMFSAKSAVSLPVLLLFGGAMISIAMGIRQSFGVLIGPLSAEFGWPMATFSFALALQNLMWGIAQPFTASLAERHGADKVGLAGGLLYGLGLLLTAFGGNAILAILGAGVMVGLAQSATTYATVLGVVGRSASAEKRANALGIASAAGSLGQVVLVYATGTMVAQVGPTGAILILALPALAMIPMAFALREPHLRAEAAAGGLDSAGMGLVSTVSHAWKHKSFRLLTIGFFVCGFQVAFVGVHLPAYLSLCGLPMGVGTTALIVIGVFNIVGSYGCGWLGGRFRPKNVLALIYLLRFVLILAFMLAPKTELVALLFAGAMGLMWLGTVPLTNSLIAGLFGTRNMGTLYGVVFFGHQIGSFTGVWAGGILFDLTGGFDLVWYSAAGLGLVAALIHLPIKDRLPEAETATQAA